MDIGTSKRVKIISPLKVTHNMALERYISEILDSRSSHHCHSLRDFLTQLKTTNDLLEINHAINLKHELTALSHRSLCEGGPALQFNKTNDKSSIPIIGNLFGTEKRVLQALGVEDISGLKNLGRQLAYLQSPKLPTDLNEGSSLFKDLKRLAYVNPRTIKQPPCQQQVFIGDEVDLSMLPLPTCWPEDVGPLLTFGLVITQGPKQKRQNIGIYRQQPIAKNQLIMRWLAHRGGATDFAAFKQQHPGQRFPVAVVIGADPATTLAAVAPVPDTLSEYHFAGLLRGAKTQITPGVIHKHLHIPAHAEIVLEGYIEPEQTAEEGPFGDHTGFYNSVESFPVFTVEAMTMRDNPLYHTSYMGHPGEDEPSVMAAVLNELFIPLIQNTFPEIVDFYLPPEACSYRMAVISINKQYPGHARRIMMAIWSFLRQFSYTKFIIVTDEDVNIRDWSQVLWALSTRADPARDSLIIDNTPVDYLDFSSPKSRLGGKMGIDATHKWPAETSRTWGRPIRHSEPFKQHIEQLWNQLKTH